MEDYKYNDGSVTDQRLKQMIPILVFWAMYEWENPLYYSDLGKKLKCNPHFDVPRLLGILERDILNSKAKSSPIKSNERIPSLNSFVCRKTGKNKPALPGDGLSIAYPEYDDLEDDAEKQTFIHKKNLAAHNFNWLPILEQLGLKPIELISPAQKKKMLSTDGRRSDAEGKEHKDLKTYILEHPEVIERSLRPTVSETEHQLLSNDRIDVYFETSHKVIAVEVKSSISDEDDIIRGIFQCVKYKAVLKAERTVMARDKSVKALLVIQTSLSPKGRAIARSLGVKVIEDFDYDPRGE